MYGEAGLFSSGEKVLGSIVGIVIIIVVIIVIVMTSVAAAPAVTVSRTTVDIAQSGNPTTRASRGKLFGPLGGAGAGSGGGGVGYGDDGSIAEHTAFGALDGLDLFALGVIMIIHTVFTRVACFVSFVFFAFFVFFIFFFFFFFFVFFIRLVLRVREFALVPLRVTILRSFPFLLAGIGTIDIGATFGP